MYKNIINTSNTNKKSKIVDITLASTSHTGKNLTKEAIWDMFYCPETALFNVIYDELVAQRDVKSLKARSFTFWLFGLWVVGAIHWMTYQK